MAAFVQTIGFRIDDPGGVQRLLDEWEAHDAGDAPGYVGSRLLADQDQDGRYVVMVEFESLEAAQANNDRPETQEWAAKFRGLIDGEPEWGNFLVRQVLG